MRSLLFPKCDFCENLRARNFYNTNAPTKTPVPAAGDDASWRKASIQPVPIPDLGHTGIRTKFSTGAGNGFTPSGEMTETFRNGIRDTVRNLPPAARGDARDMKTRDYARAVRKHRVDPCGGSLLHAHMTSLELDGAAGGGAGPSTPFAGGAGAVGFLRQSSSLGTFRSRFSPPSSPLSTRRALAGYGRGGASRGGGSFGGLEDGEELELCSTPADRRQALLRRELSSVKLAVAAATAGAARAIGNPAGGEIDCGGGGAVNNGRSGASRGRQEAELNAGWGGSDDGGAEELAWTVKTRARGKRRGRPTENDLGNGPEDAEGPEEARRSPGGREALPEPLPAGSGPSPDSQWQGTAATPTAEALTPAKTKSRKTPACSSRRRGDGGGSHQKWPSSSSSSAAAVARLRPRVRPRGERQRQRHLKKPFSSDSLLSCLLDVRFGNTRDLSPKRPPGQKWDLRALPSGIAAGIASAAAACTAGGWDGFDESEDLRGSGGGGSGGVGTSVRGSPGFLAPEHEGDRGDRDFAVVCGGGGGDGDFGDVSCGKARSRGRERPASRSGHVPAR